MRYLLLCLGVAATSQAAVVRQSLSFDRSQFELSATDNYAVVTAGGMDVTNEPGKPQLPVMPQSIELPGRCAVRAVRVKPRMWSELERGVVVQPAQPQVPFSVVASDQFAVTGPDPDVYGSSRPYPAESWRWTGTGTRGGTTVVDVVLYPVRYVGADSRLEFCRGFDVEVEYESVTSGQLPVSSDQAGFEYVIVTAGQYDSVFQRLADWKTEKGVPAVVRHIDWVLSTYPGRDNAEKLRNYFRTLPDSGVKYVLLGGDVSVMPYRKAFAMVSAAGLDPREDSLPCDLYFSDLDGDWDRNGNDLFGEVADSVDLYPDVTVGRAPVDNLAKARAFVDKVLEYERNPAQPKQANALFCAEILWQNPLTDQGVHKNKLARRSFSSGYDVTKLYKSTGNENRTSVMQAIRDGQNYLNHDGHGWIDVMSVGGFPDYIKTADADTITNAYRGIIYSIGCWTTAFDRVSVGEAFVSNPNGGTVATVGNSSYGWGSPGNPGFGYSDRFDDKFWWMVQQGGAAGVGDALARAREYFVPFSRGENVYRWHQYQLNLMGDPEMPVWTAQPGTLDVAAPAEIPSGTGRVLVTVASQGQAVKDALVCLMKSGESYSTARTGADGAAWLEVESHSGGDFLLTATARDFLPFQETIGTGTGPYVNFAGWIVNDSLGNNDGIVNQNETVRLPVRVHNAGNAATAGIPLKLRTAETVVEVLDSTASCGSLAPGESTLLWNAFEIHTGACVQDGRLLRFEFTVEDTDMPRVFRLVLQLGAPVLALKSHSYTMPPALPGSVEGVKVVVDNNGHGYGHGTWARLVSLDPNVSVSQPDSVLLGELAPQSRNTSDSFNVSVSSSCPGSYLADMRLDLWCEEHTFTHPFELLVGNYGFSDDMEAGPAKWTHGGSGDLWGISSVRTHSGSAAWYSGDSAARRYYPNTNAWLVSTPFMVAENCTLRFWRWFSVPNYGVDGIYVVIVRGSFADTLDFIGTGGALEEKSDIRYQNSERRTLEPLNPGPLESSLLGIESDWFEENYDLAFLAVGETIQVRLGFKSDSDTLVGEGFYIDDAVVAGGNPPPTFIREGNRERGAGSSGFALAASPNPFRNSVVLRITYGAERRTSLRIYDAAGRCVRAFRAVGHQPSGVSSLTWDGRDERGRRVGAGTYFVRAQAGKETRLAKVLLVRD